MLVSVFDFFFYVPRILKNRSIQSLPATHAKQSDSGFNATDSGFSFNGTFLMDSALYC